MSKHIFKSEVHHGHKPEKEGGKSKIQKFLKGHECPKELVEHMHKLGVLEKLPEPVKAELHAEEKK